MFEHRRVEGEASYASYVSCERIDDLWPSRLVNECVCVFSFVSCWVFQRDCIRASPSCWVDSGSYAQHLKRFAKAESFFCE